MLSFETERLVMRPLHAEDEAFYCACYIDPLLMRHIGEPLTPAAAKRSFNAARKISSTISPHRYTWAMKEKKSGATIGLLAMIFDQANATPVTAELGNIMLTHFQNRGYTVEALGKLINLTFETTNLVSLVAGHKIQNAAVTRVMTKLGFVRNVTESSDVANCKWVIRRIHWLAHCPVQSLR